MFLTIAHFRQYKMVLQNRSILPSGVDDTRSLLNPRSNSSRVVCPSVVCSRRKQKHGVSLRVVPGMSGETKMELGRFRTLLGLMMLTSTVIFE